MSNWSDFTPEQQQELDALIFAGRKIEAIRRYRELAGGGLRDGKEAVEAREAELRERSPQSFAAGRSGCLGVLLLAAGVAGLAVILGR